jgi:hypothetical protein
LDREGHVGVHVLAGNLARVDTHREIGRLDEPGKDNRGEGKYTQPSPSHLNLACRESQKCAIVDKMAAPGNRC